jgi:chemotaxis protein MotB
MGLGQHRNRHRAIEHVDESDLDSWLITYADMITLMLCFCILLLAVSEPNMALFEQLKSGMRTFDENKKTPLAEIKHDLDSLLVQEKQQGKVTVDLTKEGITLQFNSNELYSVGKADLNPNAKPSIDKVIQAMQSIEYYKFQVDIEGHTDNRPIRTVQFPSNWELSVSRATNLVKYMIEQKVEPDRLKAAGYADTKPLVPNVDSASGADLPLNQARNRRILIRIH